MALPIKVDISRLDFDSTPPLARTFPSGLNESEVTLRPIVPAAIVPSTLVIIAVMSAMLGMFGMFGIDPRFMFPGFGNEPTFGNELALCAGEDVSVFTMLPEATSHREISPWLLTVAST